MDVCYSGPMQSAESVLAPYRRLGKPLRTAWLRCTIRSSRRRTTSAPASVATTTRGPDILTQLERGLIDAIVEVFGAAQVRQPRIALPAQGGAIKRIARDATALWHRDA